MFCHGAVSVYQITAVILNDNNLNPKKIKKTSLRLPDTAPVLLQPRFQLRHAEVIPRYFIRTPCILKIG